MEKYDHKKIEEKWQKEWEKSGVYKTKEDTSKPKCYVLDMFPYPSGVGLHVGHPKGYIATDVYSRYKRMGGFNVLHPMGWDAFGLPAENYAIKNKVHPRAMVEKNVVRYKEQLSSIGFDYDWSREINTTDPEYYKWTQWTFLKMLERGLAYQSNEPVNWCPSCQTVLANEDLEGGKCERCGSVVEKKPLRQWVLKITDYADRMLEDLDKLDWPRSIKESQKNWIGRSEGAEIEFKLSPSPAPLPEGEGKPNFLILHGFTGQADKNFIPWLKKSLENEGFKVQAPQLPDTDTPKESEQVNYIIENCQIDENTIIIGHSLGAVVAMKLLQKINRPIAGLVLIAAAMEPTFKFKEKEDRIFWKTFSWDIDYGKLAELAGKRLVLSDLQEDEKENGRTLYLSELSRKLKADLVEGQAERIHFCAETEPIILKSILSEFKPSPLGREGWGYETADPKIYQVLQDKALGMRKNPTEAEDLLWQELRDHSTDCHFRRQHIIGKFIVDFVCLEKRLVVEVDGDIHDYQKEADEERTNFLEQNGFKVIRFRNEEVLKDIESVKTKVNHALKALSFGEGLGGASIKVFTTRPDTLFGVTYVVLAPEHPLIGNLKLDVRNWSQVENYLLQTKNKTEIERTAEGKEKTGVILEGVMVTNPANGEQVPVWVADYVLANYGTGAVMAVPQHDERDKQFAKKYNLPIIDRPLVDRDEATEKYGKKKVTYKLRDWVFSRQRYWGEPIPVIHCEKCGVVPVPEKDLPVRLPEVENYEPTGTGESPLANIAEWVNVKCPKCGGAAKRETNTMPQWAGSSWYYLRYIDPKNSQALVDKQKDKYWSPVDFYVGGAEHATRHLIYARFWHKFLFDIGVVNYSEPFTRLQNVGLIMAEDGRKMSKRYGNVINPDDVVKNYGADTLRVYEMFMGPFDQAIAWSTESMIGPRRFLEKVWKLAERPFQNHSLTSLLAATIKKVGEDIEAMRFNTAISSLMILVNEFEKNEVNKNDFEILLKLLSPFAPHITEELWQMLGNKGSIHESPWPKYEQSKLQKKEWIIIVQINGVKRDTLIIGAEKTKEEVEKMALNMPQIAKWLEGKKVKQVIYVPNRIVNFVV